MKKYFILFYLLFNYCLSQSQNNNDSLLSIFNNAKLHDTVRLNAILDDAWKYNYSNPDSAIILAKKGLIFANEKGLKKSTARALNAIGNAYTKKGVYPKALSFFQQSLKLREEIKDTKGQASTLVNIGVVYLYLNDYPKALSHYNKSLKISKQSGNKAEQALALLNIGIIYKLQKNYNTSLVAQLKALKIYEELGEEDKYANCYSNIGQTYSALSDFPKALDYHFKALKIIEDDDNKWEEALCISSIGEVYSKQKQSNKAISQFIKALQIAQELGDLDTQMGLNELLYKEYKIIGDKASALKYYEKSVALKDSINNSQTQKEILQKEVQFEFDKKQALAKADQIKKDALDEEKHQKQNIILSSLIVGFFIVVLFTVMLVRRNQIVVKQKNTIEAQKDLILTQQTEMVDSITYAKRIQDAILPPLTYIKEKLPESFIFFKPKAIVAGDFYWVKEIEDTILIAAADCTGHGVPGAMVSVVCSNALNRAVKEFNLIDTNKILDKTSELVIETFEKSSSEVKDGMDISLLSINKSTKRIQWTGANNPLWYFVNNELNIIKADKQHIGVSHNKAPFTSHIIEYKQNMMFYLFTDGYCDQFGGPKGKKLRDKYFQEILSSVVEKSPSIQKQELILAFENWKGNLEQVDDVCVIGIRI